MRLRCRFVAGTRLFVGAGSELQDLTCRLGRSRSRVWLRIRYEFGDGSVLQAGCEFGVGSELQVGAGCEFGVVSNLQVVAESELPPAGVFGTCS